MKQKRIAFIVTKMDQGGAMALPIFLADELRKRGHVAEVWYLYKFSDSYEDEPGVRVLLPGRVTGLVGYFRVFVRLLKAMRRFRPDAAHGVLPLGNVFGLTAAAIIGCPARVASQHNPAKSHNPVMQLLDKILGTTGVYTANIAVSQAVWHSYKTYPRAYVRRLKVIQNAVPHRPPNRSKEAARASFKLPQEAWIIGNVGRLSFQKHQEFLFDVLRQLPEAHLAVAGEGELRDQYEQQVRSQGLQDRVHLLGSVPDTEMPDFYAMIDSFALPSRYEGLPISLVEAMNAGLPILASDIPPLREVLEPEDGCRAGIILSVDSVDPWVEAIHTLIDNPEDHKRWSEASLKRAKDFSPERMVDQYEAAFFDD